ncbi:glucocorticoid modulatory element-binding protein 2 isoform X1 [Anguilla anguilla]|uniref:glucocorticoid modulatory element-binding protein 2 isoform X1 n=2 Tax=Anguilla anguilla TaxID=7936 RepID=UPI0015AC3BEA|nr:glucocorticoid modulatory element-binding protein 2 isoform X1 [Anguilla anguilla]XP_035243637.1 glucocorticoid modulatory element-binding protein 2 isoform X1 [Anguilla anguilla]XP_035243638.1 glucocorticoid modulatory element-binding protein 2 isoform X1 [Anguilla anguilla]
MASTEVSMHVEEVVVVTTPDTAVDTAVVEEVKTMLVTTELAQQGEEMVEENMEHESETSTFTATPILEKEAVIAMKLSEEVENMEAEIIYPITCGDSKAALIWKKFVCPGINIKCVQYNEHLISPKEFVHLAGKSTLKDWKRAIRLNGIMLRKIMDSGELDFYQHTKVCSNTCRSTKIDLVGSRTSFSSQQSTEYIPVTPSSADVNGSPATFTVETTEESTEWVTTIGEDTVTFWRGLKDAGLLEEVVEEFQKEVKETLKGLQDRIQQPPLQVTDAVLLNNIVQNFGMLDLVKKVLASHKSQMDRYREQYTRSLVALEQQCDEHRKRAKELKSKSQHLNNVLMTLTPVSASTAPKRPRLTRATSGPASVAAHAAGQPAQITLTSSLPVGQLAGLSLDKVVSALQASGINNSQHAAAFTAAGSPLLGGYTVLASPGAGIPGAVEIQPDASNLTVLSTAAIQDGGTIVKVMSPFQLLTLPGLGAALQNVAGAGGTIVAMPTGNIEAVVAQAEEAAIIEVKEVDQMAEKQ